MGILTLASLASEGDFFNLNLKFAPTRVKLKTLGVLPKPSTTKAGNLYKKSWVVRRN